MTDFSALLWPYGRKRALKAVDNGDAGAFTRLYNFFAAQTHAGMDSEFDAVELESHREFLAKRAHAALLCPSIFPKANESEAIRRVASCILGTIVVPDIEYLEAFLTLMERKEITYEARLAMAECLQKFLPGHADIFEFDSLEKRIVSAMVGESEAIFLTLDELLCLVKERYAKTRAESEPN